MTYPQQPGTAPPGCPARGPSLPRPGSPLIRLYGPEFSARPQDTYRALRELGPVAPVEIAPGVQAQITTTYASALYLLRNTPQFFAKSPRYWRDLAEGRVPPDSPALMMMQERDNALWKDGHEHVRLRTAISDSLQPIEPHRLRDLVKDSAGSLISQFAACGSADLVGEYAAQLPMMVLFDLFGCPQEIGHRIVGSLVKLFDAAQDAAAANAELEKACLELTYLKRRLPGPDVTSRLIAHPAALTDAEMIQTILLVIGAGTEPSTNLIGNALALLITDDRFSGSVTNGAQSVAGALDHVLWTDPPMANYSPLYAYQDFVYEGVLVRAGVPILVSFAAANTDPSLNRTDAHLAGNHAHLAFSAGAHGCPAPHLARIIAEEAVTAVLNRLPGLDLAVRAHELVRRPGTFHSGWTHLPVTFPPLSSLGESWTPSRPVARTSWTTTRPTSPPKGQPFAHAAPPRWWNFPARWWRGQ